MYHISVSKELFEDISTTKQRVINKEMSRYWKKELLDIEIINDKIKYNIKKVDRLKISNGLGDDKPMLIVDCEKIEYNGKKNRFDISLGRIIERRNNFLNEDYKDNLIEQLLREKEELQNSINKDHLTSIYNRKKMEEDLEAFINQRNASTLSATFIDADKFKNINDTYGHDVGDDALRFIASKLSYHANLLNGEVYRYGGEEFVLLCFTPKEFLLNGLERLRIDIDSEKMFHPLNSIHLTVSMGVAFFNKVNNKNELLKKADSGVLKAKELGRNRIEVVN